MSFKIIIALVLGTLIVSPLCAKELDSKIEKTAQKLATAAQNLSGSTLSVFPFQADDNLSKKKVNIAVSEMLTTSLLKQGSFKLTERARLEEVMKEQKLGLSGAVDSGTAADIGKLIGAKLLILGNVIQVGNSYQITSKMVNSESGEIITSEIMEVPVKTFDEDAERYLVLVPEREALGLYASFSYWPLKIKDQPPVTVTSLGKTITPDDQKGNYSALGIGLRYQVAQKWILDAAILPVLEMGHLVSFSIPGVQTGSGNLDATGIGGRLSLNRSVKISTKWRGVYGAGYQVQKWTLLSKDTSSRITSSGGTELDFPDSRTKLLSGVFARGGLEWRVKERFAWSLLGQLNQTEKITFDLNVVQGGAVVQKVRVLETESPLFFMETTIAFYF